MPELVDALRQRKVLEAVLAPGFDRGSFWGPFGHQVAGDLRKEDLPALCRRGDTRRLVVPRTPGAPLGRGRALNRGETHAHADVDAVRPVDPIQRLLAGESRLRRIGRLAEGNEEGVTFGSEFDSSMRIENLAKQPPVLA